MNIAEYLKGLNKRSKAEEIPGTVEKYSDEECPTACGGKMMVMKPCCGSPKGSRECRKCHYSVPL